MLILVIIILQEIEPNNNRYENVIQLQKHLTRRLRLTPHLHNRNRNKETLNPKTNLHSLNIKIKIILIIIPNICK